MGLGIIIVIIIIIINYFCKLLRFFLLPSLLHGI